MNYFSECKEEIFSFFCTKHHWPISLLSSILYSFEDSFVKMKIEEVIKPLWFSHQLNFFLFFQLLEENVHSGRCKIITWRRGPSREPVFVCLWNDLKINILLWEHMVIDFLMPFFLFLFFLFFYFFFNFILFYFLFVVNFVIHWNAKALGSHVFPIPITPPTSLPTRSLQVPFFLKDDSLLFST